MLRIILNTWVQCGEMESLLMLSWVVQRVTSGL